MATHPRLAATLRYLRGTVTGLCVSVYILLIAIWVRSYWWCDTVVLHGVADRIVTCESLYGGIGVRIYGPPTDYNGPATLRYKRIWAFGTKVQPLHESKLTTLLGFGGTAIGRSIIIAIPCWFVTLASTILALVIWRTTRWRFSLRTLLIATSVVAVLLGLVIWAAN
jgi:hypothetical protein